MENKDKETVSLKSILVRYLHHWKLFLVVFIISFIPAILYLTFYPRTYEFAASVLLQEEDESGMASFALGEAAGLMKSFGIGGGGGSINLDDEMAVITSNRMLRLMINELRLNVLYSEPYSFYNMYNEAPLKLTADSVVMANLDDEYRFSVSVNPGKIKVGVKSRLSGINETYTYTSLPANIKVGKQEFTLDFDNNGLQKQSFKLKIKCIPVSWLAETFSKEIDVEDVSSSSNVLTMGCSEHSMERGKDMLNVLIKKYNEDKTAYNKYEDNKTMDFVNYRISNILADLSRVESDIEVYKKNNEMTLLESDVMLYGEVFKELQASLVEVEMQVRQINMLDEFIKNPENKNGVIPPLYSVAEGEKGVIGEYNKAIVQRDRFLKNSNELNPMFKIADSQVEQLRNGVHVMIENARKSMAATLGDLRAKESRMLSKMSAVPEKEREYISLRRDQEILQGLYLMLLQKREETILSLGKQTDFARVIEPAYIKKKPLGPRKLFAAIGMLVFTLVIPIGYLFTKDLFRSIKEEYKSTSR